MPITELSRLPGDPLAPERTFRPDTDPLTLLRQTQLIRQAAGAGITQPGGFQGGGITLGTAGGGLEGGGDFGPQFVGSLAGLGLQGPDPAAWGFIPPPGPGGGGQPPGGGGGGFTPQDFRLDIPSSPFRDWFIQNVPGFLEDPTIRSTQEQQFSPEQANMLLVMNALLPFLGPEDVGPMSRFIAQASGGSAGPFGGYLEQAPVFSPVREELGERRRLEDAMAVGRLFNTPAFRALSEGRLGGGLSTLGLGAGGGLAGVPGSELGGPQPITQRSRAGAMRFLSELGGALPTSGAGAAISPFLQRLLDPTQLRALPGQLVQDPSGQFVVSPNPQLF